MPGFLLPGLIGLWHPRRHMVRSRLPSEHSLQLIFGEQQPYDVIIEPAGNNCDDFEVS
jgi:hypothetical protein